MKMVLKPVLTYERGSRLLRVGRLMWERGTVGDGKGYSAKLSLALWLSRYGICRCWREEDGGWIVSILGIRFHYVRSYGGRFV